MFKLIAIDGSSIRKPILSEEELYKILNFILRSNNEILRMNAALISSLCACDDCENGINDAAEEHF